MKFVLLVAEKVMELIWLWLRQRRRYAKVFFSLAPKIHLMRFILLLLLLPFITPAFSQSGKSVGMYLGIPFVNEKLKEGREYKPFQLLLYYNFTNLLNDRKNDLWVYLEPQFVWVHFSPKDKNEVEFGANLGLEYRLNISAQTAFIAAIGSGPHYISVETKQQAKGYIFSDNFTAGIRHRPGGSGIGLDLKFRYRHISNAGIKNPNKGIDSWFVIFGATKDL